MKEDAPPEADHGKTVLVPGQTVERRQADIKERCCLLAVKKRANDLVGHNESTRNGSTLRQRRGLIERAG
jgi:hypothetical protein